MVQESWQWQNQGKRQGQTRAPPPSMSEQLQGLDELLAARAAAQQTANTAAQTIQQAQQDAATAAVNRVVGKVSGAVQQVRQGLPSQSPILRGFPEPFEHWEREQLNDDDDPFTQYKYSNVGDDSDQLNANMYG